MTDMSLHPGQKHLIIFHTWIVLIVLIVPIVSRDQGGNECGWRDQICWTLCLYHCPHRSPSRCRIHPLARADLSRRQLRQLFVNKGDSRYLVCSSWNICILVDSFFIACPWIVLNILLECYSSTRWCTGIYSQRQGSRFVLPSFVWQVDTCQLIPSWLPQCWDQRYQLDEVSSNLRPLTPHRIWALDNNTSKHLSILKSSESLVFEVGDCMKVLHLSC